MPRPTRAQSARSRIATARIAARRRWPGELGNVIADLLATIPVDDNGQPDPDYLLLARLADAVHQPPTVPGVPRLTAEQAHYVALLSEGYTAEHIANELGKPTSSVRSTLSHAYRALGASSQGQAVAVAIRWGLLPAGPERRAS